MPQPITATFKVDAGHVASPSGGFRPVIPDESLDGREPTTSQDGDVSITNSGHGWDEGPDGDTAIAGPGWTWDTGEGESDGSLVFPSDTYAGENEDTTPDEDTFITDPLTGTSPGESATPGSGSAINAETEEDVEDVGQEVALTGGSDVPLGGDHGGLG